MVLTLNSPEETKSLARKISEHLNGGETIFLIGELGSGKTYFTKMLAEELGVTRKVKSPTFVLFRKYEGEKNDLYHFDLYRLENSEEEINIDEIGLSEALADPDAVKIIEWADLLGESKVRDRIEIRFKIKGEASREVEISVHGGVRPDFLTSLEK